MERLKNIYTHRTAKERDKLSFPAKILNQRNGLIGEVLDFGCGFGSDVKFLHEQGYQITGYDPHYFPKYPKQKFDTIICFYVLNVLLPIEQARVLMEVSRLLKPGGIAYFAVRRDLMKEGYRMHRIHEVPTYQTNVKLAYVSFFVNDFCEIYAYRHYNTFSTREPENCPFCNPDSEREIITESATAYAIWDKYPVNKGHALIIPKRHTANYFELSFKDQSACWFMLNYVKEIVAAQYNPNGFNVGVNIHEAAGQTVSHVHVHLIPRYDGDVDEPRGGVRGVVPERRDYDQGEKSKNMDI
jgi:diadenosine tetraphosphate (Ap4A) HIT family hydrolase